MNKTIIYIIGILFLCSAVNLKAQSSVKYAFGFDFTEGIYVTYNEFKNNSPGIRQYRVKVKNDILYSDFTDKKRISKIEGRNSGGGWITFKEDEIWGICNNDQVFIFVDKAFHEITKIGALMYVTIVFKGQYDVLSFSSGDTYVGPAKGTDITTYLIDFETGEYYLYNLKNFTRLLKRDNELYDEFMAINGKKQKKYHMLMYLEKFNNRNPVYFPENPFQ